MTSHDLGVPVLSIGNLTVGGTGKSPMIDALLSRLTERGCRAMVLSRGYGAQVEQDGVVLNDEGHMMRYRHPGHVHVQGADRVAAARAFLVDGRVDIILLDDGAQHLQVRRDAEILMFDGTDLIGHQRCLPAGPWRESIAAAQDCSFAVVTGDLSEEGAAVLRINGVKNVSVARRVPCRTTLVDGSEAVGLDQTTGQTVGLVSAIGRPDSFARSADEAGLKVFWSIEFPDHDALGPAALSDVAARLEAEPVDLLLTTSKDAVKLSDSALNWRVLEIELELTGGWGPIDAILNQMLP